MSPRKLTDATKQEILKLYRETEETTSTLAERYEVSSSTISRFLKNFLSEVEYEELIQQKRLARTPRSSSEGAETMETSEFIEPVAEVISSVIPQTEQPNDTPVRRQKVPVVVPLITLRNEQLTLPVDTPIADEEEEEEAENQVSVSTLKELFGEEIGDLEEDEDWDDEEDEDEEDEDEENYQPQTLAKTTQIQVLPLSSAAFPKTCYLVIDRMAELITRPLKDFAELGKVPSNEIQQRTLPVFDSHRVARRFSKRRERVIKVPDGRMIQKTLPHLEAKGITRLLMDGRIYSLSPL